MKHLETPSLALAKKTAMDCAENHFSPLNCIFLHFSRKSPGRKWLEDKFCNEINDLEAVVDVHLKQKILLNEGLSRGYECVALDSPPRPRPPKCACRHQ